MKITQIMTKHVQVCQTTDSLARAVELMWEHDIGALPVVDHEGRAIGMITDRDACMAAFHTGESLRNTPVSVAMSTQLVSCRPDDSYSDVVAAMSKRKIRRVPVVDPNHRPIGIVSLNDLALGAIRRREVPATDVAAVLAAISEHRPRQGASVTIPDARNTALSPSPAVAARE